MPAAPPAGGTHAAHPIAACTPATPSAVALSREVSTLGPQMVGDGAAAEKKPGAHALPHAAHAPRRSSWYCPEGHMRHPRLAAVQLAYGTTRNAFPPQSHGTNRDAIHAMRSGRCFTS